MSSDDRPPAGRRALLERHRWLVFILPLAVYLVVGSFEPSPEKPGGFGLIAYSFYPYVYVVKLLATAAAIVYVLPGYRGFAPGPRWLGAVVGAVGVVVWVGLCHLQLEQRFFVPWLQPLGLDGLIAAGARGAYNPLEQLAGCPGCAYAFLAVRFIGLVLIVPLIEEFFYRGFLMRFPLREDWWNVPLGQTNAAGVLLAIALPVAMHPAEAVAAAAWFGMIAWLYVYSRSLWECVVAHAVTNLLLGIYVVATGHWELM